MQFWPKPSKNSRVSSYQALHYDILSDTNLIPLFVLCWETGKNHHNLFYEYQEPGYEYHEPGYKPQYKPSYNRYKDTTVGNRDKNVKNLDTTTRGRI